MKGYVNFTAKHRILLTVLLFITFIISANGARQIQLGGDFDVFVPNESVYADRLAEMEEYFPSSDQMTVQIKADDMSMGLYKTFTEFNRFIGSMEGMEISGPVSDNDPDGVTMQSVVMYCVFTEVLGEFAPVVEKNNATYYTFTIFSEELVTRDDILAIENWLDNHDLEFAMAGDTYMQLKVFDFIAYIISRVPPLALGILLIVFFLELEQLKEPYYLCFRQ